MAHIAKQVSRVLQFSCTVLPLGILLVYGGCSQTDPPSTTKSSTSSTSMHANEGNRDVSLDPDLAYAKSSELPAPDPIQVAAVLPDTVTPSSEVPSLKDVQFGFDEWQIPTGAQTQLQESARWLEAHPEKVLTIEGHADARGTTAYNEWLAQRRADAVQQALIALGIPEKRLVSVSYGNTQLQCVDPSQACHQENRRVHFAHRTTEALQPASDVRQAHEPQEAPAPEHIAATQDVAELQTSPEDNEIDETHVVE